MEIAFLIAAITLVVLPIRSETTAYINMIICLFLFLASLAFIDWASVLEGIKVVINSLNDWLLVKADGDTKKVSLWVSLMVIVAILPFIFGFFFLFKKSRGMN